MHKVNLIIIVKQFTFERNLHSLEFWFKIVVCLSSVVIKTYIFSDSMIDWCLFRSI